MQIPDEWAESLEMVIKNGANVNAQNSDLKTPLHVAAYMGSYCVHIAYR